VRRGVRRGGILPLLLLAPGCGGLPLLVGGGPCTLEEPVSALPLELPESSGLAAAERRVPGTGVPGTGAQGAGGTGPGGIGPGAWGPILWSHNDSGWDPVLFRLGPGGELEGTVRVVGARNVDWEAMAAGPCPEGRCLYIADTGDNLLRRTDPAIYRVTEPGPRDTVTAPATRFPVRLPDGPRDIEAMALLADGHALLITKGWGTPIEVLRTPEPVTGPAWREPLVLERVQTLDGERRLPRMVTGAAATPDGGLIAVRTYESLRFFRPGEGGRLDQVPGSWVNLRPLREPQGEAVAFLSGNRIALTSEAGPWGRLGQLSVLTCRIPGYDW
jgi:hypothetical protein